MRPFIIAAAVLLSAGLAVEAATLRVAPISIELKDGAAASSVRVWNDDREGLRIQARVFKWTMRNGKDVLEPTRDVVASPPMTTLAPGTENIIRVVRISKQPIAGRETYRLIIDQLPDGTHSKPGTISVLVRHAIPLSFE